MGNFNKDHKSGSNRSFGKRNSSTNRDRKPLQLHNAICGGCGKECQLPFKPNGDRPVYCRDCFAKNGNGDTNKSYGRDNHGQSVFQKPVENRQPVANTEQLDSINYKLDRIIKLLTSSVDKLPEIIKEEAITIMASVSEEQPVVLEKKKQVSRKVSKAPKE